MTQHVNLSDCLDFNGVKITLKDVLKSKFTREEKELIFEELKEEFNVWIDRDIEKILSYIESLLPYFKQR